MCKHVLNAQVSIRSPCCRKWFDCAECHAESESHQLKPTLEMVFACKKCRKCFRKDVQEFEESDEYCPHCDNHFMLDAVTPQARLEVEGEDVRKDARMLKDERVRQPEQQRIWDIKGLTEKMG
ncbi:hypothetical protein H2203_002130 [Taxawa tesnikishii (nom. ined.)]|nr:hypothetical protein H2203_002130 [Dothideales sp. JES 119]